MLSQKMRQGDGDAAFSLLQRRRALLGVAKRGWKVRLARANSVRLNKHRLEQAEKRSEAARIAAMQERRAREHATALERNRKQALMELEIRQQLRTPASPERSRPQLPDRVTAALRARYGPGGVTKKREYRDNECRPVFPGEQCPFCKWQWGDTEPRIIAVP